jgi:hypothetical protein
MVSNLDLKIDNVMLGYLFLAFKPFVSKNDDNHLGKFVFENVKFT